MLAVLKVGGSVLTDKNKEDSLKLDVVERIVGEIATAMSKNTELKLILVLGGGCYGHIPSKRWGIQNGVSDAKQLQGVFEVRQGTTKYALKTCEALNEKGVRAQYYPIMSIAWQKNKKLKKIETKQIEKALAAGITPLIIGELSFDEKIGISIISGDAIVPYLAHKMNADITAIGSDVNGIYDSDPKANSNARLVEEINNENYKQILKNVGHSRKVDVTGGMKKKLQEVAKIAKKLKKEFIIFNALENGSVEKVLLNEKVKCTRVILE